MHHGGDAGAAKSSQGTEAGAPGSQQPVYSAPAQFGAPRYVVPSGLSQAQAVSMSSLMPPQMMQARGGVYPAAAPGAHHRNAAVLVPTTGDGSAYQVTPEMMYEVRSPSRSTKRSNHAVLISERGRTFRRIYRRLSPGVSTTCSGSHPAWYRAARGRRCAGS